LLHVPRLEETSSRNELLYKMPQRLTLRKRSVTWRRRDLIDGKRYTLEEISKFLGLTRERVRQIQAHAYRKLRNSSDSANLSPYV
jgi:RNA polymerase primary sigma factor